MVKNLFVVFFFPLLLNFVSYYLNLSYFTSVNFVLGGMLLILFANSYNVMTKDDWKLFFGISIFSNIFTLLVEVIMLKFDVWGFTNDSQALLGYHFLGAPVEEYNFWFYCPGIVGFSYILFSKSKVKSLLPAPFVSFFISIFRTIETKIQRPDTNTEYVKDSKDGKYTRGNKYPVYIYLQILLIGSVIYMRKMFRGSVKATILTTALFFFTMFPYEQYAIAEGFWTYNTARMIGLYILNVPVEGWCMYIVPPIAGSMITNIISRKFFKKEI